MNLGTTISTGLKEAMYRGNMDFDTHPFKMILTAPGFSFSSSKHLDVNGNLKCGASNVQMTCDGGRRLLTITTGSFISWGFVSGSILTLSGAGVNDGKKFRIRTVNDKTMYVDDSLGYTLLDDLAVDEIVGPPKIPYHIDPVEYALDVEDEKTNLQDGYPFGGATVTFTISGDELYLDGFDFSVLGGVDAMANSGGGIIYNDNDAVLKPIVAYVKFTPWKMNL